ncbi:MAG: hypothetical protein KGR98_11645, partial [Verrucomicrobia bacterium]|nr:hypothetical protein [Verrucomicrobiota bacterium]
WNGIQVGNWPVRTLSRGHSQLVPFSMTVGKNVNQYHVVLRSARAIDHGRIRIGPFGTSLNSIHVICNGKPVAGKLFGSGDSKWVWVDFGDVDAKRIEISAKAL